MAARGAAGAAGAAQGRLLPGVNGAGYGVVAVVHSVGSPAVAPHTLGAVVPGHSQVLQKVIQKGKVSPGGKEGQKGSRRQQMSEQNEEDG